ncbi:MAG TPA: cation-transporting P-type ATPase [Candidatus Paceibacterota bacterium]|nr:cation-transporting P-type ATPase [Candidatus Paceibacterota bacterium]
MSERNSPENHWHARGADEVVRVFGSSPDGLSEGEAAARMERYGRNEFPEHGRGEFRDIVVRQFTDPLILILLAAGAASFALHARVDAIIIFGAVLINAAIGFWQEYKVSAVLAELRGKLKSSATVIRDGRAHIVDATGLVPGDIIALRQGERVPADGRVIAQSGLKTNEAVLTGESMPVAKQTEPVDRDMGVSDQHSMVFTGSLVAEGTGTVVVTGTGLKTEFGAIAGMVMRERGKDVTRLQVRMRNLAKTLGTVFVVVTMALFVVGVATGRDPLLMLLTAVATAVAAVPESLPVSLGIVLAIGARRILDHGGLVRKMSAAESLGSVTLIATDKTATLTEGVMEVVRLVSQEGTEWDAGDFGKAVASDRDPLRDVIERLALSSSSAVENPSAPQTEWKMSGTPVDRGILRMALKAGLNHEELPRRRRQMAELPFDARRKNSAVVSEGPSGPMLTVLGAPEVIIGASEMTDDERIRLQKRVQELAHEGFRVLAVANRSWDSGEHTIVPEDLVGLQYPTLVVFSDPVRGDVAEVIATAQRAGARVVMVTGDHAQTAEYVARQTGILRGTGRVVTGKDLPEDAALITDNYDVFARVSPADKVRIVQAFQERGETTAVLGDGVNDAPALVRADIGVAVGSGTEVAKEASDLILLGDNFRIIVQAIRQGRIIFDNIAKVGIFLLSDSFTEIVLLAGSIMLGLPLALLPAQLLWVNIIEGILPAVALAWDRTEEDVMRQRPRRIGQLFSGGMRRFIAMFAVITSITLFLLFVFELGNGSVEHARTMTFVGLGITSMFYVFSVRSLAVPVWKINPFANWRLNVAVILGLAGYVAAFYLPFLNKLLGTVPLNREDLMLLAGLSVMNIGLFEAGKRMFLGRTDRSLV